VRKFAFADLVNVDGTTLIRPSLADASTSLRTFNQTAALLDLRISWPKTELQNLVAAVLNH